MPVNSYVNIQAEIADILARDDLTSQIVDAITLFESEASYELFRTRGTETRTILVPGNPSSLTISSTANNGSGLVRVTLSATPTVALTTGDIVGIGNTGSYNGSWAITVISATIFDLVGSTFSTADTTGTVQQDIGFAAVPTDYLGWSRLTSQSDPVSDCEYVAPGAWAQEFPTSLTAPLTGIPKVFTIEGGFIKVKPATSTNLEFLYWAKTPALSGSFNWLATNRPDAYVVGALEKLYGYWIKDFNQAEAYGRKKTEIFNQIKMLRFREFNGLHIRLDRSSYGATP